MLSRNCRDWFYFPIEMPVTNAGWGPATVGLDADKITYCVWDKLFNEHGSFDNLYDAINEAMRLNHEDQHSPTGKGETNPLKDRGKMIKPFPGAPAGGYPLPPANADYAARVLAPIDTALVEELVEAATEVSRISDRDHVAWHRLSAALTKLNGDK
jgi:hypothetical protein